MAFSKCVFTLLLVVIGHISNAEAFGFSGSSFFCDELIVCKDCVQPCKCIRYTESQYTVRCVGRGTSSMPSNFPNATTQIHLAKNKIRRLTEKDFTGLSILEDLDISRNEIEDIEVGTFKDNTKLRILELEHNRISVLKEGVFSGLTILGSLKLAHNRIRRLLSGIFKDLIDLRYLYLSFNLITDITNGSFHGLVELYTLTLQHNKCSRLERGVFLGMPDLSWLNLSENGITEIADGAFLGLPNLRYLYLTNLTIPSLTNDSLEGLSALRSLYFQKCNIPKISRGAFWGLWNLQELVLIENGIQELSTQSFLGLSQVDHLSLLNNNISFLPEKTFEGMYNLNTLALTRNALSELSFGAFSGLPKLTSLDLRKNRIASLRKNTFDGIQMLQVLSFGDNAMSFIEDGAFQGSHLLRDVSLQKNALTNISLNTLRGMPYVKILSLGNNEIRHIEARALAWLTNMRTIELQQNKLTTIHKEMFAGLGELLDLYLNENEISYIEPGSFQNLADLEFLDLANNNIQNITSAFEGLKNIWQLDLFNNLIVDLGVKNFEKFQDLSRLNLAENRIEVIESGAFSGLQNLQLLNLSSNMMADLHHGVFTNLTSLEDLLLSNNKIRRLDGGLFRDLSYLLSLDLSNNEIKDLKEKAFQGLPDLQQLFLSQNTITHLNSTTFDGLSRIWRLEVQDNSLKDISPGCFSGLDTLAYLRLGKNKLSVISRGSLDGLSDLTLLLLSENNIKEIERESFRDLSSVQYLDLSRNQLSRVSDTYFGALVEVQYLNLAQNPLQYIDELAFENTAELKYMNIVGTAIAIFPSKATTALPGLSVDLASGNPPELRMLAGGFLFFALRSTGYQCLVIFPELICTPCALGTYSYGILRCEPCPAGGFYQDITPFVGLLTHGIGCKMCPPGKYISPESVPGKAETECKGCPQGTRFDRFAGFRACGCIEGFYRLDRFGACQPCPSRGLLCRNESVTLKAGFYWKWKDATSLALYQNLTNNLMIFDNSYDRQQSKYTGSFPIVYACPVSESCLGGMESKCTDGYQGPLCAVCRKGYYRIISTCQKCPTLPWLIGQIFLVVLVLAIIIGSLTLGKKRKTLNGRSVTDIFLARLKIIVGFYQVTSGTLTSFSYISWPNALLQVINFARVVQLNLLQIIPMHCFNNELNVDTYATLLVFVAINVLGVTTLFLIYHVSKLYITRRGDHNHESLKVAISESKEQCYRYALLLVFLSYPALSAQILQMLPQACHKICTDTKQANCEDFLRFDYSVGCYTPKYNSYVIFIYLLLSFVVGFPLVTLFLLWRNHSQLHGESHGVGTTAKPGRVRADQEHSQEGGSNQGSWSTTNVNEEPDSLSPRPGNEISQGMRFLYENYSESCWFWEVVELARKVILTSALALVGAESRTQLGVAALVSGFYSVVFAHYKPISDSFEYWLQLTSLAATSANMSIGMLLKIPAQEVTSSISSQLETVGVTVLLVFNNLVVTIMMIVRIGASFFRVVMSFKERPQCNLECCLSMVMVMNDATGEASGFTEETSRGGQLSIKQAQFELPGLQSVMDNVASLEGDTEEGLKPKHK